MKITIGNPVQVNKYFDTYELEVTSMSGDADAYNTSFLRFKNDEEGLKNLEKHIKLFKEFEKIPSGYHNEGVYIQRIREAGQKLGFDDARSDLWDILGGDVTCETYMAALDGYDLFYYDSNGVKYHAQFEQKV